MAILIGSNCITKLFAGVNKIGTLLMGGNKVHEPNFHLYGTSVNRFYGELGNSIGVVFGNNNNANFSAPYPMCQLTSPLVVFRLQLVNLALRKICLLSPSGAFIEHNYNGAVGSGVYDYVLQNLSVPLFLHSMRFVASSYSVVQSYAASYTIYCSQPVTQAANVPKVSRYIEGTAPIVVNVFGKNTFTKIVGEYIHTMAGNAGRLGVYGNDANGTSSELTRQVGTGCAAGSGAALTYSGNIEKSFVSWQSASGMCTQNTRITYWN